MTEFFDCRQMSGKCTPDRDRTCGLSFRKASLYPTELRGQESSNCFTIADSVCEVKEVQSVILHAQTALLQYVLFAKGE